MRDVRNNNAINRFGRALKRHRNILFGVVFLVAWAVYGFLPRASAVQPPQIDDRWTVTVNGQTVRVNADGSFRLPNIAAADVNPVDFKSDDWFQVVGTATIDGVTWYAYSEPFQIEGDAQSGPMTYNVLTLPVTQRPPADIPESIAIEVVTPLTDNTLFLNSVGGPGSTAINVMGTYAGVEEPRDITLAADGTTYRTSNRGVVDVAESGGQVLVTATGIGTAFVTATHRGATAVTRFVVTTPCVDTLLVGNVEDSGGFPVQGAIISSDGGSNAPAGTNTDGGFSFSVCYTPSTPFSVVVVGPASDQKAVLTDITPVPNGVTDVGTIVLEGNIVFWDVNGTGDWGDPPGSASTNWHTGLVPDATSRVFINIEDRTSDPVSPYTVNMPSSDVTVSSFTLDSSNATITTSFLGSQFTVANTARLLDGKVEWRTAGWQGGTFINDVEVRFFGFCSMIGGIDVINNGLMRVKWDNNAGELFIADFGTTFQQASEVHDLEINGRLRIRRGAVLVTLPQSRGMVIAPTALVEVRQSGSGNNAVFNHNGGTLTIRGGGPGLVIDSAGTCNINNSVVTIEPNGSLQAVGGGILNFNSGVINNDGIIKVHAGGILNYNGGVIVGDGGDGNGIFFDGGTLNLAAVATAPAKFRFRHFNIIARPDGSPLTVPAGQTLIIEGAGVDTVNEQDRGIVTTPGDLTNEGTIILDSVVPQQFSIPASAVLRMQNDNMLTNEGSIVAIAGVGGERQIDATLFTNNGTITANTTMVFRSSSSSPANLVNTGLLELSDGTEVRFEPQKTTDCVAFRNATIGESVGVITGSGGLNMTGEPSCGSVGERTFENGGVLEPGGDQITGTLTVTGGFTQSFTGVVNIELGGTGQGQFDVLAVTHGAALDGTLTVSLLPGYTPVVDDSFEVLTFTSRTGDFTTYTGLDLGNGLVLQPSYTGSALVLTVAQAVSLRAKPDGKPPRPRGLRPD